jgi:pyruvate dehydrogenase E1 component beta subunit
VVRDGKDCTIVAYGLMVHRAMDAANELGKNGVDCEVIDLRTLSPLDWDTVLESVENTGRCVCVDEAHPRCSIAADVAARVAQEAFGSLKAGVQMVTAPHTPVPFSPALEDIYIPSALRIMEAVKKTMAN